jgi:predicted Zn-dependent protease
MWCLFFVFLIGKFVCAQPTPGSAQASVSKCTNTNVILAHNSGINPRRQVSEWAQGRKLAAEMERYTTLLADPVITQYLNGLEARIVSDSALSGCFVVKLIRDPEPNAYSLPGGFLYVSTGLILTAENEAQLAAALAHETGHVTARHLSNIDRQRHLWGRLALAAGPAGYLARRLVGPLLSLKLLRSAEFEADQLGLKYQIASSYDPAEFSRLLQIALSQDGTPPSFMERLMDSHPSTTNRAKHLQRSAQRISKLGEKVYVVDTSEFQALKARLARLVEVVDVTPSSS